MTTAPSAFPPPSRHRRPSFGYLLLLPAVSLLVPGLGSLLSLQRLTLRAGLNCVALFTAWLLLAEVNLSTPLPVAIVSLVAAGDAAQRVWRTPAGTPLWWTGRRRRPGRPASAISRRGLDMAVACARQLVYEKTGGATWVQAAMPSHRLGADTLGDYSCSLERIRVDDNDVRRLDRCLEHQVAPHRHDEAAMSALCGAAAVVLHECLHSAGPSNEALAASRGDAAYALPWGKAFEEGVTEYATRQFLDAYLARLWHLAGVRDLGNHRRGCSYPAYVAAIDTWLTELPALIGVDADTLLRRWLLEKAYSTNLVAQALLWSQAVAHPSSGDIASVEAALTQPLVELQANHNTPRTTAGAESEGHDAGHLALANAVSRCRCLASPATAASPAA